MKQGLVEALQRLEESAKSLPPEVVQRRQRQYQTILAAEEARQHRALGLERPKPKPQEQKLTRDDDWVIRTYG